MSVYKFCSCRIILDRSLNKNLNARFLDVYHNELQLNSTETNNLI